MTNDQTKFLIERIKREVSAYGEEDFTEQINNLTELIDLAINANNQDGARFFLLINNTLKLQRPIVLMKQKLEQMDKRITKKKRDGQKIDQKMLADMKTLKEEIEDGSFDNELELLTYIIKIWPDYFNQLNTAAMLKQSSVGL